MQAFGSELLIGVLLSIAMGATAAFGQPARRASSDVSEEVAKLVEGDNRFALDIFAKVRKGQENEFLSPFSISEALAMVYEGARGQTARQMAQTLHFDLPQNQLAAAFEQLTKGLHTSGQGSELLIANALWAQQGYDFRPDYISRIKTQYGGKATTLDFRGATEAARQTINKWVEAQTHDKIKDLIKPGMLEPLTRLVLTNAIYFKGAWMSPFTKSKTAPADFTTAGGKKVSADMMNQQHRFQYYEDGDLQILQMSYRNSNAAMFILLPRKADGLAVLEQGLDVKRLTDWISKLSSTEVKVSVPKFRVERDYALSNELKSMGMKDAFSASAADFTGMAERKELYMSFVVHKTYVKVDEEGTEAAAATGIGMAGAAMIKPEEPKIFRADHPFLFLIRDVRSGSILFLGQLMDPTAKGG